MRLQQFDHVSDVSSAVFMQEDTLNDGLADDQCDHKGRKHSKCIGSHFLPPAGLSRMISVSIYGRSKLLPYDGVYLNRLFVHKTIVCIAC